MTAAPLPGRQVGLLYHLYNQFAFNTLGRVTPVAHGVCNVVKRVCIIGTSVVFFGNKMSQQTKIGTVIALVRARPATSIPPPPSQLGSFQWP